MCIVSPRGYIFRVEKLLENMIDFGYIFNKGESITIGKWGKLQIVS